MIIINLPGNKLQRPLNVVPRYIIVAILLLLTLHITISGKGTLPKPSVEKLAKSPPIAYFRLLGFGDDPFLSRMLVLWLQMHDYQPGISLSYQDIDYQRLVDWLGLSLELDPEHDYPLLLASRVYSMVNDVERQRTMLDFVAQEFKKYPGERWQWLTHAVYMAKHRVKDKELALEYARLLADTTQPGMAPKWARQMHVFILADMGEVEAAKVLLGALYESGQLKDEREYSFLLQRLERDQNN